MVMTLAVEMVAQTVPKRVELLAAELDERTAESTAKLSAGRLVVYSVGGWVGLMAKH